MQEALAKVRKRIGDLGWDILQERLTQDKPRTLEELGQRWGVSRERVRQVELKTKNFLERYLAAFNQDEESALDDSDAMTADAALSPTASSALLQREQRRIPGTASGGRPAFVLSWVPPDMAGRLLVRGARVLHRPHALDFCFASLAVRQRASGWR